MKAFVDAVRTTSARDTRLLAGFAYASLAGVNAFIAGVGGSRSWDMMAKRFVIGIHHAVTEPSALEALRDLGRSEVRVFIPGVRLSQEALVATPVFHPKVVALARGGSLSFFQAGSANMTSAALGVSPNNYECSVALHPDDRSQFDSAAVFAGWWTEVWNRSRPATDSLIQRYATIRLDALEKNPILRRAAGPPVGIEAARHFFIEVGAASGPPESRHQVEFPRSLAAYFGQPSTRRRELSLMSGGSTWNHRPLSHKVTTFGVDIWRLGMPTQNSGGEPIAHRAICFTRGAVPGAFDFEVVDTPSPVFSSWQRRANRAGHLGATHGQSSRIYGFF